MNYRFKTYHIKNSIKFGNNPIHKLGPLKQIPTLNNANQNKFSQTKNNNSVLRRFRMHVKQPQVPFACKVEY